MEAGAEKVGQKEIMTTYRVTAPFDALRLSDGSKRRFVPGDTFTTEIRQLGEVFDYKKIIMKTSDGDEYVQDFIGFVQKVRE